MTANIFISWSGSRSKNLALALHDWLKAVVQRANPWMSERDIEAGQRWNEEVISRLKETHIGIICLTPENLKAPWLLFESGALSMILDSARLVPVLFGLSKADFTYPLAHYQAIEADRDGFLSLATLVNRFLADNQLSPTILSSVFQGLWHNLELGFRAVLASPIAPAGAVRRSDREVLEDVLESVRSLQRAVRSGNQFQFDDILESSRWEDYYIRGVNLANSFGGSASDTAALCAYGEAIARAPSDLPTNTFSRLYGYRGAPFKRLNRLAEAEHDLLLAQQWAAEKREIEDAMYNMACVKAMGDEREEAIRILQDLISRNADWAEIVKDPHRLLRYFASIKDDPAFKSLTKAAVIQE